MISKVVKPLVSFAVAFALGVAEAETPILYGDGIGDDTGAIQAMIDSGRGIVKLPRPKKHYLISRTLKFGDGTGLELETDTRILLAPGSSCPLAANRDLDNGNKSITIIGGIWDMDNVHQAPNPWWRQFCSPPQMPEKHKPYARERYMGHAFYFESVKGFRFSGVTIRNPVTYAFHICRVSDFTVENVTFDFTTCHPVRGNMDGIHLDGGCRHGRIAHIRGTAFDDMVALNANDADCAAHQEAISDIEIEDIQADYCHSAIRFLSVDVPVERVVARNIRGYFYAYAIGFTHYFPQRSEMGHFTDISITDVKVGKATPLAEFPWAIYARKIPTVFYDENIHLTNVHVDDFEVLPALKELPEPFRSKEGVKVSERFGFDPVDSTRFLQAALDSGLPKIIIDAKKDGPWFTLPLQGRSNQTIVFEEGAYIVAKRGEYKDPYTSRLITFSQCSNVVIRGHSADTCGFRMWRDDYDDRVMYKWSEWRHGIQILSCEDVTLDRISSNFSGGDGLYIADAGGKGATREQHLPECRNIVVRRCLFDRNYRQGISVIAADGLWIEDTVMSNTQGTDPQAGVDFEPNEPWQCLKNIVLKGCKSIDNWGMAFDILTIKHDRTSESLDIRFIDCESIGGLHAFRYGNSSRDPEVLVDDGRITFDGCRFARSRKNAVKITRKPYSTGHVEFKNCRVEDCGLDAPDDSDIDVSVGGHPGEKAGGYVFDNVRVRQRKSRAPVGFVKRDGEYDGRPSQISGRITVTSPDGKETEYVYDEAWRAKNLPYRKAAQLVVRVKASLKGVQVIDRNPGKMSMCEPVFYRGNWFTPVKPIVFYAAKPGKVHMKLMQALVGNRTYKTGANTISLYRHGETDPIAQNAAKIPETPEGGIIELDTPDAGFYALDVPTGGNGVAVLESDVPIAYDCTGAMLGMVGPAKPPASSLYGWKSARLFFWVPNGSTFANLLAGDGTENASMEVIDPTGKTVWNVKTITDVGRCQIENAEEGLWSIRVGRPQDGVYEDFLLGLNGVPGWYFFCGDKYWK